jgi:hypothetical protein
MNLQLAVIEPHSLIILEFVHSRPSHNAISMKISLQNQAALITTQ